MDNPNDLISRATTIKEILKICPENTKPGSFDEYGVTVLCGVIDVILKQLPAVDAVPVVHARWTTERTWTHDGEWYCSACEYEPVVFVDSAYCPNCGAKMDGERRESE